MAGKKCFAIGEAPTPTDTVMSDGGQIKECGNRPGRRDSSGRGLKHARGASRLTPRATTGTVVHRRELSSPKPRWRLSRPSPVARQPAARIVVSCAAALSPPPAHVCWCVPPPASTPVRTNGVCGNICTSARVRINTSSRVYKRGRGHPTLLMRARACVGSSASFSNTC